MKNRMIIWIAAGAALVILLLLILFARSANRVQWREHYRADSKDPFGTYVIRQLLGSYFPGEDLVMITDSLATALPVLADDTDLLTDTANYVFIGEAMYMSETDVDQLLDFVAEGNRAFIACRTIPYDLMFYVYTECDSMWWDGYKSLADTAARFSFVHQQLKTAEPSGFVFRKQGETLPYEWQYIDSAYICDAPYGITPLGWMNDTLLNFASINYGGGVFYLHTAPVAFTNIQLRQEAGLDYAGRIFSHLAKGPVYWDEHSRISLPMGRVLNNRSRPNGRYIPEKSPLQFILEQPPLAWAWYLILATGLLYMVFRARRRQRVVPVLEPNSNTSLEFISTIGRLYFLQNNHRQLAMQQSKLFFNHIRERYQVQPKDADWKTRLAAKSGIGMQLIEEIAGKDERIRNASIIQDETLIDFHQAIEKFYQQSK